MSRRYTRGRTRSRASPLGSLVPSLRIPYRHPQSMSGFDGTSHSSCRQRQDRLARHRCLGSCRTQGRRRNLAHIVPDCHSSPRLAPFPRWRRSTPEARCCLVCNRAFAWIRHKRWQAQSDRPPGPSIWSPPSVRVSGLRRKLSALLCSPRGRTVSRLKLHSSAPEAHRSLLPSERAAARPGCSKRLPPRYLHRLRHWLRRWHPPCPRRTDPTTRRAGRIGPASEGRSATMPAFVHTVDSIECCSLFQEGLFALSTLLRESSRDATRRTCSHRTRARVFTSAKALPKAMIRLPRSLPCSG